MSMEKKKGKQPIGLRRIENADSAQVKTYFEKVFELSHSGQEFPVDLDEVWPLVYSRKDNAVKELQNNFIEDVHYQVLRQKAEQTERGGHNRIVYHISVPCMEFLIASKRSEVFEVYRQVFHATINRKPIADWFREQWHRLRYGTRQPQQEERKSRGFKL